MQPTGTIEICTVNYCSNFCDYCPQKTLIQAQKSLHLPVDSTLEYMSLDLFKRCLDKIPNDIWCDFSGFVEPALNPNLGQMIQYAYEKGHKIRIYTTGNGLTKDTIDQIYQIPFVAVVWHVPDNLNILKVPVNQEYCVIMDYFCRMMRPLFAHCFGPQHSMILEYKQKGFFKVHIEQKELSNVHLITRASNTQDSTKVTLVKPKKKQGKIICRPIYHKGGTRINHNVLLYNGLVVLCCCDYSLSHKLGNLGDDATTYESLYFSPGYKQVVDGWADESIDIACRHCDLALEEKDLLLDENRR